MSHSNSPLASSDPFSRLECELQLSRSVLSSPPASQSGSTASYAYNDVETAVKATGNILAGIMIAYENGKISSTTVGKCLSLLKREYRDLNEASEDGKRLEFVDLLFAEAYKTIVQASSVSSDCKAMVEEILECAVQHFNPRELLVFLGEELCERSFDDPAYGLLLDAIFRSLERLWHAHCHHLQEVLQSILPSLCQRILDEARTVHSASTEQQPWKTKVDIPSLLNRVNIATQIWPKDKAPRTKIQDIVFLFLLQIMAAIQFEQRPLDLFLPEAPIPARKYFLADCSESERWFWALIADQLMTSIENLFENSIPSIQSALITPCSKEPQISCGGEESYEVSKAAILVLMLSGTATSPFTVIDKHKIFSQEFAILQSILLLDTAGQSDSAFLKAMVLLIKYCSYIATQKRHLAWSAFVESLLRSLDRAMSTTLSQNLHDAACYTFGLLQDTLSESALESALNFVYKDLSPMAHVASLQSLQQIVTRDCSNFDSEGGTAWPHPALGLVSLWLNFDNSGYPGQPLQIDAVATLLNIYRFCLLRAIPNRISDFEASSRISLSELRQKCDALISHSREVGKKAETQQAQDGDNGGESLELLMSSQRLQEVAMRVAELTWTRLKCVVKVLRPTPMKHEFD